MNILPIGVPSDRIATMRFDIVIVGGGAAGASCALSAAARGLRVAMIAKGCSTDTNTSWARGGVAAVLSQDDSFDQHVADTLACGGELCDERVVRTVVEGGPKAIERLINLGATFDRRDCGTLSLGREGGHKRHRIVHASGDATGPEVQQALRNGVQHADRITTFQNAFALDVLTGDDGQVTGLIATLDGGQVVAFETSDVVLATGGAGQIYRETTNPVLATGDGLAMGLRAGATARDLEFYQFHPTCLYIAGAARVLISEIVRGGGGVLRDKHGDRFMVEAHPDAELAPRDIVTRAISIRMAEHGDTNVFLDLSEISGNPHDLYPGISRTCRAFGIDIASDPVPVRPGAHYMIGGLRTDLDGRTSVSGLWAVGECASSGLHGANRMGSNSLLEGLVIGDRCGGAIEPRDAGPARVRSLAGERSPQVRLNLTDLTYSMKSLMWRHVGVERTGTHLGEAASQLAFWATVTQNLAPPVPQAWELRNMLLLAQAMTDSAAHRNESRGAHYRLDFPAQDAHAVHTDCHLHDGQLQITSPCREEASA
ncbi:MAG: L-aspartate oxidase [Planctomycetes bacterium]|nr:L-aspartate oxidase [Planctomycetota bacterium]MCP4839355.1 L-aspartate oxidase [Planctomycetota bacterium]